MNTRSSACRSLDSAAIVVDDAVEDAPLKRKRRRVHHTEASESVGEPSRGNNCTPKDRKESEDVVEGAESPPAQSIKSLFGNPQPLSNAEVLAVEKKLVDALVSCDLPLSTVNTPEFRSLLEQLNPSYSLPHRTRLSELVDEHFTEFEQKLSIALQSATDVSFTADSATTKVMGWVIPLTAHWVCENWKLHSAVIGVAAPGSRPYKVLCNVWTQLRERWKLSPSLLVGTSCGAADIVRCLGEIGDDAKIKESFRCASHTLNLVVNLRT